VEKRAAAFARLFEAVHEGVYIGTIGPESSSTIAANPHLKLIFGYASDASDDEVCPFDRDRFVDPQARIALLERLTSDGSVNDYLLRLRRADSNPVWVELTARADRPAEDHTLRIEALVRDVSERKKLDDETRDIYHQLLQAEKMAALGQTVSGVAHELNNPLATILSHAERLSQRTLEEPVRRGLETILSESERAARIVRNLLTFARKRQTTRAMVDINLVVRETMALRAYEQRVTNVTVIDALAAGLPNVFADGHQVQQVLLNLVINAEQAMLSANGRGTLVVRTWHDADQESVILEINDDGPGIPDDLQPKIFEPFFTTKEVGKGTGLGLSVAYAIVQEHGGRIRLESRPGSGASFYVELPVTGAKLPPAPVSRAKDASVEAIAGASILVVEDEAKLASAVVDALRDVGYLVDYAPDGEEALKKVQGQAFDVVICDLKMPRVDGMTFYRMLSAAAPGLSKRVIFVTGDVAGTDAETFLQSSGCRWLAKPFRLGDLLRTVRETLT
jgi:two-component system cell cycle sensor histidine kinase/response regulator CckA